MKTKLILLALFLSNYFLQAQGNFVNLGFESANLTPTPPGGSGGFVPISQGLPGWDGYLGTNQRSSVLHNNLTIGGANISILGSQWTPSSILEGGYTVALQAGGFSSSFVNASISQTGLVPFGSQSIFFKAAGINFSVSFGGQDLSLIPVVVENNYTLYGGDISQFANQSGLLTFTSLSVPTNQFNTVYLDSIQFSTSLVPEPSTFALTGIGALLLGVFCQRNSRRK